MIRNRNFKFAFIVYLLILVILCAAALIYVRVLLINYEASQPERKVEEQIKQIKEMAQDGNLRDYFEFPEVKSGKFEEGRDVKSEYYEALSNDMLKYELVRNEDFSETELEYNIKSGDVTLINMRLETNGETKTKLAVFTTTEWNVAAVTPVTEPRSYDVEIPSDFTASLNGIALSDAELASTNDSMSVYHIDGIYLNPNFEIVSNEGVRAEHNIVKGKVTPVLFDYTLTIPSTISVTLNKEAHEGTILESGMTRHIIRALKEPEVILSDVFGNKITYKGETDLPLTYHSISVPAGYNVKVEGAAAPDEVKKKIDNPDYEHIKDYCSVPEEYSFEISILKKDAKVEIIDGAGNPVEFNKSEKVINLIESKGADAIPADVASQIDVLEAAKTWSLFMSKDLTGANYGFNQVAANLIGGSYLYNEAYKWATGIDITFTSTHTLANPPFINESVTNYVRLSDNLFTCDISFEKQMILTEGNLVPDKMNSRFYFVKYDATNDGIDNPVWKIANIKEIVNG